MVKATKTKKRLIKSLTKLGDILKYEKWTTRKNKVTIIDIEEKILNLRGKPDDGSQFKSLIERKDTEIAELKSHLKIPNIHLIQTIEIHQLEREKEQLLVSVAKHTTEVE